MNPDSLVGKRLRRWLPWLVHSLVLTVLLTQLAPAATQAQSGGDNKLFLPAASANGTQSNTPSSSEASDESVASDSPGDRLPSVEGETIEIVPADTVSASSIASVSSTYLNGF